MERLDSTERYQVNSVILDWVAQLVRVVVADSHGRTTSFDYTGETAKTLMTALNKADLSVKSLHRRVLERLMADQKLAVGTLTGVVD